MSNRTKSNIIVSVIDASGPLAQALEDFNAQQLKKGEVPAESMDCREVGYVQTEKGMFCLCTEGVGDGKPITADNKLDMDLYPRWPGTMSIIPVGTIELTDAEILMLPTKREVPLEDFIRSFGRRLESNYDIWLTALTKAKPMAVETHG